MTKEELLQSLAEGVKIEETAIPIYSRNIESTLFLSGFDREKVAAIQKALTELKSDSERHRLMFLSLIKKVRESEQNVY